MNYLAKCHNDINDISFKGFTERDTAITTGAVRVEQRSYTNMLNHLDGIRQTVTIDLENYFEHWER